MGKGVVVLPFRLLFCRASVQSIKLSAESGLFYLRRLTAEKKLAKNTHLVGKSSKLVGNTPQMIGNQPIVVENISKLVGNTTQMVGKLKRAISNQTHTLNYRNS